jgi:hypothetical protein
MPNTRKKPKKMCWFDKLRHLKWLVKIMIFEKKIAGFMTPHYAARSKILQYIIFFFGPLRRKEKHKNLDIERFI